MIINLKGNEVALSGSGNGNNFSTASCIKVNVTSNAVIELRSVDSEGGHTLIGNTTLLATNTYFIEKDHTDLIKLVSGTAVGTPVGFTIS